MIPPQISDVFGFHFKFPLKKNHKGEIYTKRAVNALNPLGYLPIIGTIVGVARIYFFNKYLQKNSAPKSMGANSDEHKAFFKAEIIRGAFELTSLGFLLLIPDLLCTWTREKSQNSTLSFAK